MRTRTLMGALALALSLAATARIPVRGDEAKAAHGHEQAEVTLRGEILDLACYLAHEARGPEHAQCAVKCAKAGQPMGLLVEGGKVYLLFASHEDGAPYEQAKAHAGTLVEVRGKSASRAGIEGLEVASVKAL